MPIFNGRNVPRDVIEALQAGRLIEAIKNWRAFSGEDLRTSKDFIEAIRPQVLGTAQASTSAPAATSGKDLPKHELLLKLLKMTASTNDAEALVAMRKANQLLASAGWDWDRLLAGKITVVGDPFGNLQRPQAQAPDAYAAPPRAPARPVPQAAPQVRAAQAQQAANAQNAAQNKYTYTKRSQHSRPVVNYDDIFSDAQAFGRT